MKKYGAFLILFSGICFLLTTVSFTGNTEEKIESVNWMGWEEAIAANDTIPKKILVFVHTEWCGWCKRMDYEVFKNDEIYDYINANYYAVKFDAEMKEDIVYKEMTFKYVPNGRKGYHELANSLLDEKLSYPTTVFLDENENRITNVAGYQTKDDTMIILKYIGEEKYVSMTYEEFKESEKE